MGEKIARRIVYERSGGVCEKCVSARATDWHHRQNRGRGKVGQWVPSNGLHLCRPCHSWVTGNPAEARRYGWSVRSWEDPSAVPVSVGMLGLVYLDDQGGCAPVDVDDAAARWSSSDGGEPVSGVA